MQINLEVIGQEVHVIIPHDENNASLTDAVAMEVPMKYIELVYAQADAGEDCKFDLPLVAWRHKLRRMQRSIEFRGKRETGSPVEVVWSLHGKEYAALDDIPALA